MSDINPMTGQPINLTSTTEKVHTPRMVFESGQHKQMDLMNMTEEDHAFMRIAEMSQKTKFATGDLSKDIPNYLTIKRIGRMMVGLLEDDERR